MDISTELATQHLTPEVTAALLALNQRIEALTAEAVKHRACEQVGAAADKILMDISQIIGGVQLSHRSILTETPGIYMEFSINNLRFCYTNRQAAAQGSAELEVSSVGEHQIIEFTLEVKHDGLTVSQLNRIEKADYDASWAGYGDNLVKYARCPQRLTEIYPREVLDALDPELFTNVTSVGHFNEGEDADVLNIDAYRRLRNPRQTSRLNRDAAVIQLTERLPQAHYSSGGSDSPPA